MKVDTSYRKIGDAHTMPPFALSFFPEGGEMFVYVVERKRYGFFNFIFDSIMTLMTYGLWLIWIFVREMRNRRGPCSTTSHCTRFTWVSDRP